MLVTNNADNLSNDPEVEVCPLCPSTGPPQPPSTQVTGEVDLVWIACTKCSTWYHSVCLFLADEKIRSTIPPSIVEEAETNRKDEGAWFNWTQWIDKWYCLTCISRASSPSNPRPPRRPLAATLKKGISLSDSQLKRSASSASLAGPTKQNKRARMSAPSATDDATFGVRQSTQSLDEGEIQSNGDDIKQERNGSVEAGPEGRPKRNLKQLDYNNLNNSIATPTNQWLDLIANPAKYGRVIRDANYQSVPSDLLSRSWLDGTAPDPHYPPTLFYGEHREPIIVKPENGGFSGLGGQVPGKDLTVQDVARLVGPKRMVDVIDVSSQQSSQWTLQKWANYLLPPSNPVSTPSLSRRKVYNIISLEISDTELAKKVKPPKIVREIDWVDNFWNFSLNGGKGGKGKVKDKDRVTPVNTPTPAENSIAEDEGSANGDVKEHGEATETSLDPKGEAKMPYPKVQLYCLMGMKGAWTDWHVDFAASSVYYTIHTGSKVFYFIRPTTENLKAYAEWSGSYEKQQDTWLPDMCDEVRKVVLKAGDTMIIPAGYIHAVYTPMDSIVFGGNFLHSYDVETQLRLRQIEIDTKVPQRFRFPMFERLCWFVADRYITQLRQYQAYRPRAITNPTKPLHDRVLSQLVHLTNFLLNQIAILHNPEKEERSKKLVWDRIPHEVIKDPEALARELQWRIRKEKGSEEDVDLHLQTNGRSDGLKSDDGQKELERELKRKKAKLGRVFDKKGGSRTWMFDPPEWEESITSPRIETSKIKIHRPSSGTSGSLLAGNTEGQGEGDDEAEQTVSTIKQLRTRIREVEGGALVKEEQEMVFVEKKIVWGMQSANGDGQGNGDAGEAKMAVEIKI
ncbi:uncharacterized protein I303_106187 [Kwoniella dejecticola CBS 10117]|uniref:JmjC domain-containing histone demethylation protein 1 n=1 Tax=Kwoniella dejecticola CBS 10117 TaxID=1296121 RepID=A0A1A6A1I1_9TREE|nr:uncharacterized protein I303_06205 [Kwoniella dejecticola CBS 10117]OBR83919.1 hypothetical protein I303_06205 [Kwoniella dejecticola CBS 10117]